MGFALMFKVADESLPNHIDERKPKYYKDDTEEFEHEKYKKKDIQEENNDERPKDQTDEEYTIVTDIELNDEIETDEKKIIIKIRNLRKTMIIKNLVKPHQMKQ